MKLARWIGVLIIVLMLIALVYILIGPPGSFREGPGVWRANPKCISFSPISTKYSQGDRGFWMTILEDEQGNVIFVTGQVVPNKAKGVYVVDSKNPINALGPFEKCPLKD